MPLQSVTPIFVPDPAHYGTLVTGAVSLGTSLVIDASAEKAAFVFRAPKSGTLARVGFRTATVTTGDTLKVSFQDVDPATGHPDGTADQFRTQVVQDTDGDVWFRTGLMTSDGTDGGAKRSVTRGDVLAVVIEFDSWVAGNLQIAAKALPATRSPWLGLHYLDQFIAAWAKVTSRCAVIAVEYDDGSFGYVPNTFPSDTNALQSIDSGSTPDEVALRFKLPVPCQVLGAWVTSNIGGDCDVVLYDSDGSTVLASAAVDKDETGFSGSTGAAVAVFPASVPLSRDTFYRVALKPTSATSLTVMICTVPGTPGAAQWDQMPGGQHFHWSERTDGGAWSDDALKRPLIGIVIDALDDGQNVVGVGPSLDLVMSPQRHLRRRRF